MKTIHQWFLEIRNPRIRERALANLAQFTWLHPYSVTDTLRAAILYGFIHDQTPEGPHYWANMVHLLDGITPLR